MPQYLLSIPKSCTDVPQHRKVEVVEKEDGTTWYDLQDTLLALDIEPKDVMPLFVEPPVEYLMHLEVAWDVFKETFETFPDILDGDLEPEMRLCRALWANKLRPMSLVDKSGLNVINSLLAMQREWAHIKETSSPTAPVCDFCGKVDPCLRCSGCMEIRKEVRYCNKECQLAGWKKHKKDGCGRYASQEGKGKVKKGIDRAKKVFEK